MFDFLVNALFDAIFGPLKAKPEPVNPYDHAAFIEPYEVDQSALCYPDRDRPAMRARQAAWEFVFAASDTDAAINHAVAISAQAYPPVVLGGFCLPTIVN